MQEIEAIHLLDKSNIIMNSKTIDSIMDRMRDMKEKGISSFILIVWLALARTVCAN